MCVDVQSLLCTITRCVRIRRFPTQIFDFISKIPAIAFREKSRKFPQSQSEREKERKSERERARERELYQELFPNGGSRASPAQKALSGGCVLLNRSPPTLARSRTLTLATRTRCACAHLSSLWFRSLTAIVIVFFHTNALTKINPLCTINFLSVMDKLDLR